MAGQNNLLLGFPEAKLLHIAGLILLVQRSDVTRRALRWDCWYSRALLLVHAPAAVVLVHSLYTLFRPA